MEYINYEILGKRIRIRRKSLHMTEEALAEKVECTSNHISAIENGKHRISLKLLMRICSELVITPDYILLGAGSANAPSERIAESLRLLDDYEMELVKGFVSMLLENREKRNIKEQFGQGGIFK